AKDLVRMIDAGTVDEPVDPDRVPDSPEELARYERAATSALENGDQSTFDALVARILESPAPTPGQRGGWALRMGESLLDRREYELARQWAETARAHSVDDTTSKAASAVIEKVDDALGFSASTHYTHTVEFTGAIDSYNAGDAANAKAGFEQVLADQSGLNDDEIKGSARYYLGMLAYQAREFPVAREHFEAAAAGALEREKGWASEAMLWRFQETT
nr:hypothetical protein [Actinomycetota bacterium]